jgi:hypothetical protein
LAALGVAISGSSCGGDDDTTTTLGGAGGAAGSGGAGAAGGSGGGGGLAPVSCRGTWGLPQLVLSGEAGVAIQSLAITEDELVLYYNYKSPTVNEVRASKRATVDDSFGPGTAISELSRICPSTMETHLDVTQDGLDVYVGCFPDNRDCVTEPCTVHHASRAKTTDAFEDGGVVASGIGPSPSIASDELTLYSSALDPSAAVATPIYVTRSSASMPFTMLQPIPGADAWPLSVFAPEVSPDGLELYGSWSLPEQTVVVSQRAATSDPFPEPGKLPVTVPGIGSGSPDLSGDCAALYMVSLTMSPDLIYQVYVVRR